MLAFAQSYPLEELASATSPKERVMNEELDPELEVVELGDAKTETKGIKGGMLPEDNPSSPYHLPA